jgi:oryzin
MVFQKVAAVEQNAVWTTSGLVTQQNSTWGLASISHRWSGYDSYTYDESAGAGTYAYIVDTGLYTEHEEFEGTRAQLGYNAYPGSDFVDNLGHGTHVAGTIIGKTYGVAKKATAVSIKVFDWGSSTTEIVLDGYTWAVGNITVENRASRSVISMSLGGPYSDAFNTAVNAAYKAGILSVVAAGNAFDDAKYYSPASAKDALTIGAADVSDSMAYFSNFGKLVDIFAPGVDVLSAWNCAGCTESISGTSMATPHVSGLVLYLKGKDPVGMRNPGTVSRKVKSLGTEGALMNLEKNTVNLKAYNGAEDA